VIACRAIPRAQRLRKRRAREKGLEKMKDFVEPVSLKIAQARRQP